MQNPFKAVYGKKKRTVPFYEMWDKVAVSTLNKSVSLHNNKPVRHYNIYNDFTSVFSGRRNITYMYSIDTFKVPIDIDFKDRLRDYCMPGTRINFLTYMDPHDIDWGDRANKNKIRTWGRIDQARSQEEINAYNYAENIKNLDETSIRRDSLVYLADATQRRSRGTFKTQMIMMISGIRSHELDTSVEKIEDACKTMGIVATRVTGNVDDYLRTYSPFTTKKEPDIMKRVGINILTDEIIARFHTYSQGKVGDGTVYWGSDVENSFPVLGEIKRNPTDAENIVVIAETGGGKSFEVKSLSIQLLNRDDMVGTINDVEGDEYTTLGYIVSNSEDVVILNMGEGAGRYFDPVSIYIPGSVEEYIIELNKEDSKVVNMFDIAYDFTLSIYRTLVGLRSGQLAETVEDKWTDQMLTDMVEMFYEKHAVVANNPWTWGNSNGYVLKDVYKELDNVYYENEDFKRTKDLVKAKLRPYFEGNGARSQMFQEDNRIDIEEIKNAKLVINSFGMKGRSEANTDPIKINLMILYAAEMSYLRSIFAYNNNKFNFQVWEEFQRFSKLGGSSSAIKDVLNSSLTGARKMGGVTLTITNRPSELLKEDTFGVFENYTTIAVGAIADEQVRHELCDRISMPLMKKELDYIAKFSKKRVGQEFSSDLTIDEIEGNPYAKAFFVYMNRDEYAVCKVRLPKFIRESSLFKTGVKIDIDEEYEDDLEYVY